MDDKTTGDSPRSPVPTGGVPLTEERLRVLAPQWERTRQTLRTMDEAVLGETEPATLFVWRAEES